MTAAAAILNVMAWGGVVAVAIALVAAGMRRWRHVLVISRAVVVLAPIIVLAGVAWFTLLQTPTTDAVALSVGISEAMNCGALALAAAAAGALLWGIARWRLRAGSGSGPG